MLNKDTLFLKCYAAWMDTQKHMGKSAIDELFLFNYYNGRYAALLELIDAFGYKEEYGKWVAA